MDLIGAGEISGKMAKDLFDLVWTEGGEPSDVAAARGMKQVTDEAEIEGRHRRPDGCEPRAGGKGEGEREARGVVRGAGAQEHGGQGEPGGGGADGGGEVVRDVKEQQRKGSMMLPFATEFPIKYYEKQSHVCFGSN